MVLVAKTPGSVSPPMMCKKHLLLGFSRIRLTLPLMTHQVFQCLSVSLFNDQHRVYICKGFHCTGKNGYIFVFENTTKFL